MGMLMSLNQQLAVLPGNTDASQPRQGNAEAALVTAGQASMDVDGGGSVP
jgi:hypothetical protein